MPKTRQLLVVAAAAVLAVSGCSKEEPKPDTKPAASDNALPQAKPQEEAPEEAKKALAKIVPSAGDVGFGVEERDRDDTLGGATNDVCAKQWPSNEKRVARDQASFWKGKGTAEFAISIEAVAYKKGEADKAVKEIDKAVSECDSWQHKRGTMGDLSSIDVPADAVGATFAWSGEDDRDKVDYNYRAVYQTKGDYLAAIYVWGPSDSKADEAIEKLTPVVAKRLESA